MLYFDKKRVPINKDRWTELFRDPEYSVIRRSCYAKNSLEVVTSWIGIVLPSLETKPYQLFLVEVFGVRYDANKGQDIRTNKKSAYWFPTIDEALSYHDQCEYSFEKNHESQQTK